MTTQTLEIKALAPGLNEMFQLQSTHWSKLEKVKRNWHLLLIEARGRARFTFKQFEIEIDRYTASKLMDLDNLYSTPKVPLDAMKRANIIVDDDPNALTKLIIRQHHVKKRAYQRTVIKIKGIVK